LMVWVSRLIIQNYGLKEKKTICVKYDMEVKECPIKLAFKYKFSCTVFS
jgi:hypothetical protein